MRETDGGERHRLTRSRAAVAFVMFLCIIIFFLLTEHRLHNTPALPYVLSAGSALLYFLMHGWHSRRVDDDRHVSDASAAVASSPSRRRSILDFRR